MDDTLEFHLLNDFQREFPLCPAPFAEIGGPPGVAERVVLGPGEAAARGQDFQVGAVFAPKRIVLPPWPPWPFRRSGWTRWPRR